MPTTLEDMRESELLRHIYTRSDDLTAVFPGVEVGPGDDCAVVGVATGQALLKVDQVVEGRHFAADAPIDLITRKSVARAVSDVAAMGGVPMYALAGAVLPRAWATKADALFDAMSSWARRWGCPLVGGDISTLGEALSGPLVLSIAVVGRPHAARGAVLRSGARSGDGVYATGAFGNSLGSGRHFVFEPRLAEASWLCDVLGERLHAMMDVSDGLGIDAGRMASASGVRIEFDADSIPMHADAKNQPAGASRPGLPAWRRALADGEDYELLFAAAGDVPSACPATGVPVTRIGRVASGSGTVIVSQGRPYEIGDMGWEHR